MTASDPHAEANHVLAALLYRHDKARKDLEDQVKQLSKRGQELTGQYQEAEQQDDYDAMQRIQAEVEELHKALVIARDALGDADQPQSQEDPDDSGEDDPQRGTDSALPAGPDGRGADQQAPPGRESEPDSVDE